MWQDKNKKIIKVLEKSQKYYEIRQRGTKLLN